LRTNIFITKFETSFLNNLELMPRDVADRQMYWTIG